MSGFPGRFHFFLGGGGGARLGEGGSQLTDNKAQVEHFVKNKVREVLGVSNQFFFFFLGGGGGGGGLQKRICLASTAVPV